MEQLVRLLFIGLAAVLFAVFGGIWFRADMQEYQSLGCCMDELNKERAVEGVK